MDRCTTFWYLSHQRAATSTWTGARRFGTYRVSEQWNLHGQVHDILVLIASASSEIYMDRCTTFTYLSHQRAAKSTWTGAWHFGTYRISEQRNVHWQVHDIFVLIASASSEIYLDRCTTFWYLSRQWAAKSTWTDARHFRTYRISEQQNLHGQVHDIFVLIASACSEIYLDMCTTFWYLSRQWAVKSTWTGARHFGTNRVSEQRNLHGQVHDILVLIASVSSEIYMDGCTTFLYLSHQRAAKSTSTGARHFCTYRVSEQWNLHGQVHDILVLIASVSSEIYMDRCTTFWYLYRQWTTKSTWTDARHFDTYHVSEQRNLHWQVHDILALNASESSEIYLDRCKKFSYLSRQRAAKSTWTGARHFRTYRISEQRNLHGQVHKISILIASVSSEIYMDRFTTFSYLSHQRAAKSTLTGARHFDTYRVSEQQNLNGQVHDIFLLIA